jgi:DNA-binding LytR/AlgR family response regulator
MNILIIENDIEALRHLEKLLKAIAPEKRIAGHCSSVREAKRWLRQHALPDLIFSVIQLPDGLSFELYKNLKNKVPVIFTCSRDKYAIEAFKANGIYYLLKPIKKEALREALARYDADLPHRHLLKEKTQPHYQERFIVTTGRNSKLLMAGEIAYFYTENKIVYVITFDNSKYVVNFTLERLEKLLNPSIFFRINRQFIINLSAIGKMTPASKSRMKVFLRPSTEDTTITSFGRTDDFCKWMLGEL